MNFKIKKNQWQAFLSGAFKYPESWAISIVLILMIGFVAQH